MNEIVLMIIFKRILGKRMNWILMKISCDLWPRSYSLPGLSGMVLAGIAPCSFEYFVGLAETLVKLLLFFLRNIIITPR